MMALSLSGVFACNRNGNISDRNSFRLLAYFANWSKLILQIGANKSEESMALWAHGLHGHGVIFRSCFQGLIFFVILYSTGFVPFSVHFSSVPVGHFCHY